MCHSHIVCNTPLWWRHTAAQLVSASMHPPIESLRWSPGGDAMGARFAHLRSLLSLLLARGALVNQASLEAGAQFGRTEVGHVGNQLCRNVKVEILIGCPDVEHGFGGGCRRSRTPVSVGGYSSTARGNRPPGLTTWKQHRRICTCLFPFFTCGKDRLRRPSRSPCL